MRLANALHDVCSPLTRVLRGDNVVPGSGVDGGQGGGQERHLACTYSTERRLARVQQNLHLHTLTDSLINQ